MIGSSLLRASEEPADFIVNLGSYTITIPAYKELTEDRFSQIGAQIIKIYNSHLHAKLEEAFEENEAKEWYIDLCNGGTEIGAKISILLTVQYIETWITNSAARSVARAVTGDYNLDSVWAEFETQVSAKARLIVCRAAWSAAWYGAWCDAWWDAVVSAAWNAARGYVDKIEFDKLDDDVEKEKAVRGVMLVSQIAVYNHIISEQDSIKNIVDTAFHAHQNNEPDEGWDEFVYWYDSLTNFLNLLIEPGSALYFAPFKDEWHKIFKRIRDKHFCLPSGRNTLRDLARDVIYENNGLVPEWFPPLLLQRESRTSEQENGAEQELDEEGRCFEDFIAFEKAFYAAYNI